MSRRLRLEWQDNGALLWTWPLTLVVSSISLVVLGAALALWAADSALASDGTAGLVAIVGFVMLSIAMLGRWSSANALRYYGMSLPQPPSVSATSSPRAGAGRSSVRRRSGIAYFFMGVFLAGMPLAAWVNWDLQPRLVSVLELALGAGCAAASYLAGPAARFVVTPDHVHIDTAHRRICIPRHLVAAFAQRGTEVRLDLTDGGCVYFRVDSPIWDLRGGEYRTNGRTQLRTVEKIVAMLNQVPAVAGTESSVLRSRRPGMTVLAVAAGLLSTGALIALAVFAFA